MKKLEVPKSKIPSAALLSLSKKMKPPEFQKPRSNFGSVDIGYLVDNVIGVGDRSLLLY